MKSSLVLGALVGLAAAVPTPQLIDLDGVAATDIPPVGPSSDVMVAQPDTFDAAAASKEAAASVEAASTKVKRAEGDCAPQPNGYGPKATPDTAEGFLAFPTYSDQSSGAPIPQGYARTFQGHTGSCEQGTYLGLHFLKTYDPYLCQQKCDSHPDGCTSFNLYFERDPSVDAGPACPNPSSITTIRCTLWKNTLMTVEGAGNVGQWRGPEDANGKAFQVVIAGSNGYLKDAPPPSYPGYTGPTRFGGAINAPLAAGNVDTYMGYKFYANGDYSQCVAACSAQTAYNARHPPQDGSPPKRCTFVNAYLLSKDNVVQGIYCSMYTQVWGPEFATNYGQYRGTNRYTVANSYGYALA
ncbi:hypothetical protein EPUS_01017 [Endocarpon pusillum Z07020]|uniref:Uncharacterized protein n=1 Tax=Endocarpon pusillum (strain Z07020 / HMAS-L-300199) TaxID=1263415 RepID=U1GBJ3_ENDPU|nr:uncharacterized protein EPUS_01017 [Endocarpon pusillum Z07020]ERF69061.1 hypothetical protein EPUS_01017 [Endocarpon pusillum Z07020]